MEQAMYSTWIILTFCLIVVQAKPVPRENTVLNDELRRILDPDSVRTTAAQGFYTSESPSLNLNEQDENERGSETEPGYSCGGATFEDDADYNAEPQEDTDGEYSDEFDWEQETNRPIINEGPSWMPWGFHGRPYPGWWSMNSFNH